jgi:hypothetical protein
MLQRAIRASHRAKWEAHKRGKRYPATAALYELHAELHPDGGGNVDSTKRLVIIGTQEDNFLCELDAKQHNGEPLSDFEQKFLLQQRRRHFRRLRRHGKT